MTRLRDLSLRDIEMNANAHISGYGALKVANSIPLLTSVFEGATLDTSFWTSATTGIGSVTVASGVASLQTGAAGTSGVEILSTETADYSAGQYLVFQTGIRPEPTVTGNNRYWGVLDLTEQNGLFFKLSGGNFKVVSRKAGVDTEIDSAGFNGNTGHTPTARNVTYRIHYSDERALFQYEVDGEIVTIHTLVDEDYPLGDTLTYGMYFKNENAANTGNVEMRIRSASISLFGDTINDSSNTAAGNLISSSNSTNSLLGASATFTGVWEDVTAYTTASVAILGSLSSATGTLYIDLSTDNGTTFTSIPRIVGDITFDFPHTISIVEQYIRIRYVNDGVAQTGTFSIQTKYSNSQPLGLNHLMGDTISGTTEGTVSKSVSTGEKPSGIYGNIPASGEDPGNSSTTALTASPGPGDTFTGTWKNVEGFHGISILADGASASVAPGTMTMEFSHDAVTVHRTVTIPVSDIASASPRTLGVIAKYFRVRYDNGAVAQTTFDLQTILHTQQIQLVSRMNQEIQPDEDVSNVRAVIVGQDAAGTFRNVPTDITGVLKVNIDSPVTAFGDLRTAELTPKVELTFPYNINTDLVTDTTANGGTVTQGDAMAILQTSTASNGEADLVSNNVLKYRAGLGGLARFTTLWETSAASSIQIIGTGDDEDGFYFGYNGTAFGVLRRSNSTDTWVAQTAWNVDVMDGTGSSSNPSGVLLDHTKLNVLAIDFQYLGAGQIDFRIENSNTGKLIIVHSIKYANTAIVPSAYSTTFPLHLHVENLGSTTNLTMKTASMAGFIEGKDVITGPTNSVANNKTHSTETALFSVRNKSTYASKTNKIRALMEVLTVANDVNQLATFRIYEDTTLGGTPSWTDINTTNSVMEYDTAGTTVTGGKVLFAGEVGKDSGEVYFIKDLEIMMRPGSTYTVTSESGSSNAMGAALVWREDF